MERSATALQCFLHFFGQKYTQGVAAERKTAFADDTGELFIWPGYW